jgi:hypothetical protein
MRKYIFDKSKLKEILIILETYNKFSGLLNMVVNLVKIIKYPKSKILNHNYRIRLKTPSRLPAQDKTLIRRESD